MKIVNRSLCTFAALIVCLTHASAQRMPQDYWYYHETWGSFGAGSGQFNDPQGVAVDDAQFIYVADTGNDRIQVLDANGAYVRGWPTADQPADIAIGTNGYIYVACLCNKVQVYTSSGVLVNQWGASGSGASQFNAPHGIATSKNGLIFVSEVNNNRVQVFDLSGNFVRMWGEWGTAPGQLRHPDGITVSPESLVYVADREDAPEYINVFTEDGTFVRRWVADAGGSTSGIYNTDLEAAPDGVIHVLVMFGGNIHSVYNPYGILLSSVNHGLGDSYGIGVGPDGTAYIASNADVIRSYRRTTRTEGNRRMGAIPLPVVQDATQRAGTTWMDIDFTVHDADSSQVTVAALAFVDGGNDFKSLLPMKTFVDNTQTNLGLIPANTERRLTWDVAADWDTTFGQVEVEILARDERANLLDIEYITIPSNAVAPELTLSRSPLTESDFYHAWLWLVATGEVELTNGTVRGIGGAYDGVYLADTDGQRALLNPEGEPNDTSGTAAVLAFSQNAAAVEGAMLNSETYDWYAFDVAVSNTVCQMTVAPKPAGSGVVFDTIYCYNTSMSNLWSWSGNGGSYSTTYTLATPGRYYIRLQRYSTNVAPGTYRLAISLIDGWSGTVEAGRQFLYERLGVRAATASEVARALEGNIPGTINKWTPRFTVGPGVRPKLVNEYGFDTGDWGSTARWVVPLP